MPIYEYRCTNEHRFEVLQKFADDALTVCEVCGAPAQRVLHPVAIHFKGSGFYSTDYGRGKKSAASESRTDAGPSDGGSKDGKSDKAKSGDGAKSSDSGSKSDGGSKGDGGSKPAKAAEA
jgi:putative FmdB family regulatory protein